MTKLKIGDTVKVHYTGKHLDGTVFDSTAAGEPIMFTIGDDMMIPGFEKEVKTMNVGEKRKVTIKSDDAYGDYDKALVYEVNQKEIFGDKKLKLGDEVQLPIEDDVLILRILEFKDGKVILDANSDLAGKSLVFDIELIEIMPGGATPDDDEFASEFEDIYEDDFDDDDEFGGGKLGKFDDEMEGEFDDDFGGEFDDEFSKGGYDEFEKY